MSSLQFNLGYCHDFQINRQKIRKVTLNSTQAIIHEMFFHEIILTLCGYMTNMTVIGIVEDTTFYDWEAYI